ncbi:MAG: helix-turn-helix transcriptional regulator [Treponema sp.]
MTTDQLFEFVYILIEKKKVTASQMAKHFGVSQRTVYRWVESLSMAEIPVYAEKGKGGGICIEKNYALDTAVLTENEKLNILAGVQALSSLSLENAGSQSSANSAITKLKSIVKNDADWIQVDFAPWNPKSADIRILFSQLKDAILLRRQVKFDYFSSKGECSVRSVQPVKIVFRGQAWYLYGWCNQKKQMRFFKLNRMRNLTVVQEAVQKELFKTGLQKNSASDGRHDEYSEYKDDIKLIPVTLKVSSEAIYRIMDEYRLDSIKDEDTDIDTAQGSGGENCGKTKIVTLFLPDVYWLKSYLISFGTELEVVAPEDLRNSVICEIQNMNRLYDGKK